MRWSRRSSSSTTPSSAPRAPATSLLADDEPLPTGEEIGRQFEQFLAGLDTQDGNDPNESGRDT